MVLPFLSEHFIQSSYNFYNCYNLVGKYKNPIYNLPYQYIIRVKTAFGTNILNFKRREIDFIMNYFGENGEPRHVLDFGCSTGFFTRQLADRFGAERVSGADISLRSIKKCRERYPKIIFHHISDDFYSANYSRYNCILLSHILEHVNLPVDFLQKIKNLMADHGTLILCVPQERIRGDSAWFENFYNIIRLKFENVHKVKYSIENLSTVLEEADLKIITHRYINTFRPSLNRKSFYNHSLVACTERIP